MKIIDLFLKDGPAATKLKTVPLGITDRDVLDYVSFCIDLYFDSNWHFAVGFVQSFALGLLSAICMYLNV